MLPVLFVLAALLAGAHAADEEHGCAGDSSCLVTGGSQLLQKGATFRVLDVEEEEKEKKMAKQPAWDISNCDFNAGGAACWGDSAYQKCNVDRQGAYDAVQSKSSLEEQYNKYQELIENEFGCTKPAGCGELSDRQYVCGDSASSGHGWTGQYTALGTVSSAADCLEKCENVGEGCCEYRTSGSCQHKVAGVKRYSSGHTDTSMTMCVGQEASYCGAGYSPITKNLDGEGKVWTWGVGSDIQSCANMCNSRAGCTSFEYSTTGDNGDGQCGTYTGGDSNIKSEEGRTDSSKWQSCLKE